MCARFLMEFPLFAFNHSLSVVHIRIAFTLELLETGPKCWYPDSPAAFRDAGHWCLNIGEVDPRLRPNKVSRMVVPVTCAFLDAIASAPDDGNWHSSSVISSMSVPRCPVNLARMHLRSHETSFQCVHDSSHAQGCLFGPNFPHYLPKSSNHSLAQITPTFASFCASSGIKQDALEHFDINPDWLLYIYTVQLISCNSCRSW